MSNDLVPDLAVSDYTTTVVPGETVDAIYGIWTGGKLNWDVYGPKEGSYHVSALNPTGINGYTEHELESIRAAAEYHTAPYV